MRLIDADALHEEMCERMTLFHSLGKARVAQDYNFVATVVGAAPTVDAVPVVRCWECKHFYTDEYGFPACSESGAMCSPEEDDYCSRGQRKDQSTDVRKMEGQPDEEP